MNLPKDPYMLLSFINTKLRDDFSSLDELCKAFSVEKSELTETLERIDYHYNSDTNSFC